MDARRAFPSNARVSSFPRRRARLFESSPSRMMTSTSSSPSSSRALESRRRTRRTVSRAVDPSFVVVEVAREKRARARVTPQRRVDKFLTFSRAPGTRFGTTRFGTSRDERSGRGRVTRELKRNEMKSRESSGIERRRVDRGPLFSPRARFGRPVPSASRARSRDGTDPFTRSPRRPRDTPPRYQTLSMDVAAL